MRGAPFVSRDLHDGDDLSQFRCGHPSLDDWARRAAHHAERMRSGRTWVWAQRGVVLAYFTLAGHVIERVDLPSGLARGSPGQIPAVLIAKLALHEDLHGRGFGEALLADATSRIVAASDIVASRFAVLDAIDEEAGSFYAHYGFQPIPDTCRLVRKIGDLAADLELP